MLTWSSKVPSRSRCRSCVSRTVLACSSPACFWYSATHCCCVAAGLALPALGDSENGDLSAVGGSATDHCMLAMGKAAVPLHTDRVWSELSVWRIG